MVSVLIEYECMVTKDDILAEIRRLANENGGLPVGKARFLNETGIRESDWSGRYWTKWGDALIEAGFQPNVLNPAMHSIDTLTTIIADFTRELGHFPTVVERKMKRRTDPNFPSHGVIENRLGNRQELLRRLVEFASQNPGYEAVRECCEPLLDGSTGRGTSRKEDNSAVGYVYLIRMGKWHKIGATTDILRRTREIRITLPEKEELIHTIMTDDPFGVERYWHNRFSNRRTTGEWFVLSSTDVRAFKKWRRIF